MEKKDYFSSLSGEEGEGTRAGGDRSVHFRRQLGKKSTKNFGKDSYGGKSRGRIGFHGCKSTGGERKRVRNFWNFIKKWTGRGAVDRVKKYTKKEREPRGRETPGIR